MFGAGMLGNQELARWLIHGRGMALHRACSSAWLCTGPGLQVRGPLRPPPSPPGSSRLHSGRCAPSTPPPGGSRHPKIPPLHPTPPSTPPPPPPHLVIHVCRSLLRDRVLVVQHPLQARPDLSRPLPVHQGLYAVQTGATRIPARVWSQPVWGLTSIEGRVRWGLEPASLGFDEHRGRGEVGFGASQFGV